MTKKPYSFRKVTLHRKTGELMKDETRLRDIKKEIFPMLCLDRIPRVY